MKSVRTKVLLAALLVAAIVGVLSQIKPTRPAKPIDKPFIVQINNVRAQAGKPPLIEDPLLDKAAQAKVDDQVNRNYWAHHLPGETGFELIHQIYPPHSAGSENIARCQTSKTEVMQGWVKSRPHYQALIGDYDRIGIAQKINPKDDSCVYTVAEFIKQ